MVADVIQWADPGTADEAPKEASEPSRGENWERGDRRFALGLLAPSLIIVGGVLLFPLLFSLWTSFSTVSTSNLSTTFNGIHNYKSAATSAGFTTALLNTLYFAALAIAGSVVIGFLMALVLSQNFRGVRILRTVIIIPWALSQVVVGILWSWIFNANFGVWNAVLERLGLIAHPRGWLSDPTLAMPLVALAFVWSTVPFAALMYLSGLQAVPKDLGKAARVDGASGLRVFRYVTLPALRYPTLIVLMVASLDGFLAFALIYAMTSGGPGDATSVLSWIGYQVTFVNLDLGQGAAIFYYLVALMLIVAGIYIRALGKPRKAYR